jgi:hypothetical protein
MLRIRSRPARPAGVCETGERVHRTSVGADAAEKFNEIPLFEGLSLGQRQMIARVADQVTAAEGETIMGEVSRVTSSWCSSGATPRCSCVVSTRAS